MAPSPFASGSRWPTIMLVAIVILALAGAMFLTAPRHEDFWWTDGASFALNGVMLLDYLRSGLHQWPLAYAAQWYLHYPALTISLYPPVFPIAEAIAFAALGFSHPAAQAAVAAFAALAAFASYRTARTCLSVPLSAAAAILLFVSPTVLLWSRQVVMEVPTLAFLLLAAAAFLSHQRTRRTAGLLGSVLFLLAATYTVGLLPLAAFTLRYGMQNIATAIGSGTASVTGDRTAPHLSFAGFANYGAALPEIVGPVLLIGSLGYLLLVLRRGWTDRAERRLAVLMLAWLAIDYLLVSVTGHFEARYGLFFSAPAAIFTAMLMARLLPPRLSAPGALGAALLLFVSALAMSHVNRVSGYDAVAQYVVDHATRGSVVLFDARESKNFVFSVRQRSPEPVISIVRADKLLVSYSILREWGIRDRNMSDADLNRIIDDLGVEYLVLQPDFWADQPSLERLQRLANSNRFTEVAAFPILSEEPNQRTTIHILRNNRPTRPAERELRIDLPAMGGAISGRF